MVSLWPVTTNQARWLPHSGLKWWVQTNFHWRLVHTVFYVMQVSRSSMPSISRLQQHVEWAWRQGFDVQGCDQLGGKLFNTRKWIGATEVVTFLSSLRIRCQLADFHRPTSPDGSHPEMFNWVLQYFQKNEEFKPPLYLQHQGRILLICSTRTGYLKNI